MNTENQENQGMKTFLVSIGVLAAVALILLGIFRWSDGVRNSETAGASVDQQEDANPLLNESQETALENIGIEPANLPSEITPAMQICFVEKLGAERAQEIADGDSPTAGDYIKVKSCLSVE